jgi:hypothetical protein
VHQRLVLLAPADAIIPSAFENTDVDQQRHSMLVSELQRLRGGIYLRDGAVQLNQLSVEGLHQTPEDDRSWHLLMVDKFGHVDACVWYMEHQPTIAIERLRVRHCPLAQESSSRQLLWSAVELELARARNEGLGYAEVGGWAVAEKNRCTSEGLVLALAGYSLGQMLGGALGMTTATVRHCSSTILRRLGGSDLTVGEHKIPAYYDPKYKCEMELLRFDSRRPTAKYRALVDMLKEKLAEVLVVVPSASRATAPTFRALGGFGPMEDAYVLAS